MQRTQMTAVVCFFICPGIVSGSFLLGEFMPNISAKLLRAKRARNDEFYTQYSDVKSECDHYRSHFFNKIIYCNCDTRHSAFVQYFTELKSMGWIRDVWFSGGLGGDDFRSAQSVERLQRADIIVTNPPFSLFREFTDLLFQYEKKFLIIGNKNAIMYQPIFQRVKNSALWFGTRPWAGGMFFYVPDTDVLRDVPAIWFTNLVHDCRPSALPLTCRYCPEQYPKYDNANAINVDRRADIPCDFSGVMGVPVSFFERFCPDQFDVLGIDRQFTNDGRGVRINGRNVYTRIFIRKKLAPNMQSV